ncbi:MAG: hypothetical protein ABFD75_07465 [Smithella sp.]
MKLVLKGIGELANNSLIMTTGWQYKAAENFMFIYYSGFEFQPVEQIARRLARMFDNVKDYNEFIRTCPSIEPEVKLWLVIPS